MLGFTFTLTFFFSALDIMERAQLIKVALDGRCWGRKEALPLYVVHDRVDNVVWPN